MRPLDRVPSIKVKLGPGTVGRLVIASVVAIGAIVGVLLGLEPVLRDLGNLNLIIFFVGIVFVSVLAGVPIAFSFGLATVGYLSITTNVPLPVVIVWP